LSEGQYEWFDWDYSRRGERAMESQALGIKSKVLDSQVLRDNPGREPYAIKPIPRDEGTLFGKFGKEAAERQAHKSSSPSTGKGKRSGDEIHCNSSNMKNSATLELYDKAGEVVVRTISPDCREVSEPTIPEDLPRPREKSEKLRGALFARKA
jgi:hypothetical protein